MYKYFLAKRKNDKKYTRDIIQCIELSRSEKMGKSKVECAGYFSTLEKALVARKAKLEKKIFETEKELTELKERYSNIEEYEKEMLKKEREA